MSEGASRAHALWARIESPYRDTESIHPDDWHALLNSVRIQSECCIVVRWWARHHPWCPAGDTWVKVGLTVVPCAGPGACALIVAEWFELHCGIRHYDPLTTDMIACPAVYKSAMNPAMPLPPPKTPYL